MRKDLFDELVQSIREMKSIEAGRLRPSRTTRAADLLGDGVPDVAALREEFKLSQAKFAALLGISVSTLQNWEQGRRAPEGAARVLLRVAATHPEALLDAGRLPRHLKEQSSPRPPRRPSSRSPARAPGPRGRTAAHAAPPSGYPRGDMTG